MSSSPYLDYEIARLLARFGKDAVLNALANKVKLSHDELESLLKAIPSRMAPVRSGKTVLAAKSIDQLILDHPDKASFIRKLQGRFQDRTFLPELRDVRRFFERHARSFGSTKSRADSFLRLFKLLADLNVSELEELCQGEHQGVYSSLGIISDAILGRHK